MALAGGAAAVAVGGIFAGSSIKKAMEFEHQLKSIEALTGLSGEEMKKMEKLSLDMGAATKYSALEAAKAVEELLKAGMSTSTVMGGGLQAALNLATAGGLDLVEAAETMAVGLNAFQKDGMSAERVADILAGTANAAATDVRALSFALASAGGVSDIAGLSFRDLNAAIGIMSNNGLKNGSDAGTSFKSMLMYLQPQTDKAIALFEELGIGVGKANRFFKDGAIKDLPGLADELRRAFGKFNEQDRLAKMMDMFGTDGVKAASTLFKVGAEGVNKFYADMGDTTALGVAKKKMESATGALELFQGAWETLQIQVGQPLLPVIRRSMLGLTDVVERYSPAITKAMENAVDKAKSYVKTNFLDNPEFRNLDGIQAKVSFVIDKLTDSFNAWYNREGRSQLNGATKTIITEMATFLENNTSSITSAALKIGGSIASGIKDGLWNTLKDHPILGGMAAGAATPGPLPVKAAAAGGALGLGNIGRSLENYAHFFKTGELVKFSTREKTDGSHSGGLGNVPYNGYVARLHQGERVMTAEENRADKRGRNGSTYTFNVTLAGGGNTEADAEALFRAFVRKVEEAGEFS
jgi:TP901 family phage tail tape measure protein